MRGMYSAGILDRLIKENIDFDICIGVSAGSGNLASYCAGQFGRNKPFYDTYPARDEYMSIRNFLKKKSFFDFDYIYSDLTNHDGENPLDLPAMHASGKHLYVVATNVLTGRPAYFDGARTMQDQYDIFKASSAIPVICRPYSVKGIPFCDGTVSDPVPIQKALDLGAEKVVVILSKPLEEEPSDTYSHSFETLLRHSEFGRKYPKALETLLQRRAVYNKAVRLAKKMEQEGRALLIYPDDLCGVGSLSRDGKGMQELYEKGFEDGLKIQKFLRKEDSAKNQG